MTAKEKSQYLFYNCPYKIGDLIRFPVFPIKGKWAVVRDREVIRSVKGYIYRVIASPANKESGRASSKQFSFTELEVQK